MIRTAACPPPRVVARPAALGHPVWRVVLRSGVAAGLVAVASVHLVPTALANDVPPSTASTSSTPGAVVEPPPISSPPSPPSLPPSPVPEAEGDATLDEAPDASVTPPAAPEVPPPPTPEEVELQRVIDQRLVAARVALGTAELRLVETRAAVASLDERLGTARARVPSAVAEAARSADGLAESKDRMRRWAIALYAGHSIAPVNFVLGAESFNDLPRRLSLARGGASAAQRDVRAQRQALRAADADTRAAADEVNGLQSALAMARQSASRADDDVARWEENVAALAAGQDVAVAAVAFPVAGANRFADTFGAPRMTGTRFSHSHQGVDIFAGPGTPVVAFERGVLARVGTDLLGGRKLWLVGQSGTRYYYAHLQEYAPGVADGLVVEAGQLLALVGNTGNALRTPHHLHFEIRPGGGDAVNPTPLLRQVADATASTVASE